MSYGVGFAATFPRSNQPHEFLHFVVGRATHGIPRNAVPARLGGRRGLLAPASSVSAYGGRYFANHVRFLWRQHGIRYIATLHTFGERATERLLDRILRTVRPARQLSASRPGGPGAARVEVPAGPTDLVLAPLGLYVTSRGTDFAPGSRVSWIDNDSLATRPLEGIPEHGTRLSEDPAAQSAPCAAATVCPPSPPEWSPPTARSGSRTPEPAP